MNKKQGGLMEATKRLKAQGLREGGRPKKGGSAKKGRRPITKSNKKLTPQEKKDMIDKIKKSQGKMTNPFLKFNKLGQPYMEAKKGGSAKFPDLSGDGKVTMKDVLMGRGVIKKPKKKADGGSVFQEARKRKPSGRLTVDDIKRATPKPSMTLRGGKLKGVKDAPEELRREKIKKVGKALGALGGLGVIKGVLKRAGKVAGRAAKRGYGIAKK